MKTLLTFVICSCLTLSAASQTAPAARKQMTNTEFGRFLQDIRNYDVKYFTREDVESMKDEIINSNSLFSTAQVRRLLSAMEKDSGKFAMARLLYAKVTDPDNFIHLSNLFTVDNYRDEFISWYHNAEKTYKAPVTL